jgi:hypothetical protein
MPNPHVYDIEVYREGRWFMIRIPELDGLTQARWPGEIRRMARSYIAISTPYPYATSRSPAHCPTAPLRCRGADGVGR